jgi:hypothetical protein
MSGDQYGRICSAIEYTLGRLHEGPKAREKDETEKSGSQMQPTHSHRKSRFLPMNMKGCTSILVLQRRCSRRRFILRRNRGC